MNEPPDVSNIALINKETTFKNSRTPEQSEPLASLGIGTQKHAINDLQGYQDNQ
jgi:hypothetical protein